MNLINLRFLIDNESLDEDLAIFQVKVAFCYVGIHHIELPELTLHFVQTRLVLYLPFSLQHFVVFNVLILAKELVLGGHPNGALVLACKI